MVFAFVRWKNIDLDSVRWINIDLGQVLTGSSGSERCVRPLLVVYHMAQPALPDFQPTWNRESVVLCPEPEDSKWPRVMDSSSGAGASQILKESSMRVIGLDPGLTRVGFGVIEGTPGRKPVLVTCGVIRTSANHGLGNRLLELYEDLDSLLEKHQPEEAGVEKIFFNINVRTAIQTAHARGVLLLALSRRGIAIHEYTPQAIKMAVLGYGKATKLQVQEMVSRTLSLEGLLKPPDTADAVAAALCHFYTLPHPKGRPRSA